MMWMKIGSIVMILLRRCLECLKNYFHLWGLRCPTRENNFLDSPVTAQLLTLLSIFTRLLAYCTILHPCPTALPGSLARKPCLAAFPGSLAWQPCPAALPGSLAWQPCPAALPGSLATQPCPAALPGSLARQPCPAALPGSLARQPCPAALPGSLARQPCRKITSIITGLRPAVYFKLSPWIPHDVPMISSSQIIGGSIFGVHFEGPYLGSILRVVHIRGFSDLLLFCNCNSPFFYQTHFLLVGAKRSTTIFWSDFVTVTARSAVGLGITLCTFTPSFASFGHLAIWSFGHLAILSF
jgi:hypothetical protein